MSDVRPEYLHFPRPFHVEGNHPMCEHCAKLRGSAFHPPFFGEEIVHSRREYDGQVHDFVVNDRSRHLDHDAPHHWGYTSIHVWDGLGRNRENCFPMRIVRRGHGRIQIYEIGIL